MSNLSLVNPNFFFLKDSYPVLYDECVKMDLAIVNEKYNESVKISLDIIDYLVRIMLKVDDNNEDLEKLVKRLCKFNNTASEIEIYLHDILVNGERAIHNSRRFSRSKAVKNAEEVYEVVSYFLYDAVDGDSIGSYVTPERKDNWVKNEIAKAREMENAFNNTHNEVKKIQKVIDDFKNETQESLSPESQKQIDFIDSALLELEKQNLKDDELAKRIIKKRNEKLANTYEIVEEPKKDSRDVVIELKTEKSSIIKIIMPEDMIDSIKPVINISYLDEDKN